MRQLTRSCEAGALEVGARLLGAARVDVQRLDVAADRLGGVGKPQRRVAVGRADLEDAPGAGGAHEDAEPFRRLRLDVS